MLKNEEHISKIAETTGLSRNTIYKIKKTLIIMKKEGERPPLKRKTLLIECLLKIA